jgi:hypothetical protein
MAKSKGGSITDDINQKCIGICNELANSNKGVGGLCKANSISAATFYDWLNLSEDNAKRYARAREAQADFIVDEIIEIADDNSGDTTVTENGIQENREFTSRSRLRVDARKWIAAKLRPKKYGDKIDVTSDGNELKPVVISLGVGINPETDEIGN